MAEKQGFFAQLAGWPKAIKEYVQELQLEMRRVTWPPWKQVRATTGVVLVCVFVFAAYFYVVDMTVGPGIQKVYSLFGR